MYKIKIASRLLLVLLACTALAGYAQTTNTVYGIIDTGVEYLSNVGQAGQGLVLIPTVTAGITPSRIGFRGVEDLGDGLKAVYTLESGIAPDTGASLQSGRLFGRQSFVGIGNKYGTITFGRQYTMLFYSYLDVDFIGSAAFSYTNFDPYISIPRADNMISYRGTFGPWSLGATYSMGRDTLAPTSCSGEMPGSTTACRGISAMVKYDQPGWGVAAAFDGQNGGPGAGAITVVPGVSTLAFSNPGDKDNRYDANGYVKFGSAKLGLGWVGRRISALAGSARSNIFFLSASYQLASPVTLDFQLSTVRQKNIDANGSIAVMRGTYVLSKRTAVYAMMGYVKNSGSKAAYSISGSTLNSTAPPAHTNQSGLIIGMKHSF